MKLIKLTLAGALLTALFVAPMLLMVDSGCSTDSECVEWCLENCYSVDDCNGCYDVLNPRKEGE